jgi:hypothetical protein
MAKFAIICEGKTERNFVEEILAPYFSSCGLCVDPVEIGIKNIQHGGNVSFERVIKDCAILLRSHEYVTTLIDFYRIGKDWRGVNEIEESMSSVEKAQTVERIALLDAIKMLGVKDVERRLFFNVIMHEFEGFLFSDPEAIVRVTRAGKAVTALEEIATTFPTPEDIDNGRNTAPSKRLASSKANYGKVVHGTRIAGEIGLEKIRNKCPHFNSWMIRIEGFCK